MRILLVLTD